LQDKNVTDTQTDRWALVGRTANSKSHRRTVLKGSHRSAME